jgi:sterol desaturase/sphingolipid hydroxylase (fatty acid hydroxylase superfamily)
MGQWIRVVVIHAVMVERISGCSNPRPRATMPQCWTVAASTSTSKDPTVIAVPLYFATMAAEYVALRRRAATRGPSAGDYEKRDTVASLSMGVISLVAPLAAPRLLRPFTPGRGRFGRMVVGAVLGAAAITTACDFVARRERREHRNPKLEAPARKLAAAGGVMTTALGAVAIATTWQSRTSQERLWKRRMVPALGSGALPMALAVTGWDFIYYWNHRLMHECRYMWAIHVVHHSSEHYNLSTALRQPVLESLGTPLPYGALCLFGVSPAQVQMARGINLLYQYWIHTESIGRLGPAEGALNTPSHHRVHHGSNSRYLDRNHGSILILWDRLFGTFEPEKEEPVYGLTKNINSFDLGTIATHEFASILSDVARSTSWRERLSYVLRGPGWADRHRREVAVARADRGAVMTAA